MKVAAIVINWNAAADTRRCVESLLASAEKLQILIVDNGSADGSREILAKEFPKIARLDLPRNTGFCGGANAGARHAIRELGANALLFLNNDAWVERGFLAPLAAELESNTNVGCAGPKVYFGDGSRRIWSAGGKIRFRENVSELIGFNKTDSRIPAEPFDCDYIPGCALLIRSELFQALGGFDESYFAYMEDVDFGVRAARKGYKNRVVPASVVYHQPSSSSGGGYSRARKYANALNSVHFLRTNGKMQHWAAFWIFDIVLLPFAWLRERFKSGGDARAVAAKWKGIRDGFAGIRLSPDRMELWRTSQK
ncbi:MAG: glycosyltransferase family 2 protein [Planctomycetota bacterium]